MPAKKTTIATAEKRVIKAEVKSCTAALKAVSRDFKRARRLAEKECANAFRAADIARAKYRKTQSQLDKREARETATITRRISILQGRL